MDKKILNKDTSFENNTVYDYYDSKLEYFLSDIKVLNNPEFFCTEKNYSDNHRTALFIENKENVVIDFHGATLLLNGDIQPIIVSQSKNIEIKNVSIKYDRSFFTEMTVIERKDDYLKVKVDPRFPYEIVDGRFIPKSDYWRDETLHETYIFLQEFDSKTREGISWPVVLIGDKTKHSLTLPWGDESCTLLAYEEGDYVVFKGKHIPPYREGSLLELCMNNRDISAITFFDSEDVKLTNVRVVNGLGMGILCMYTKNVTIDGLRMEYDEESVGIISNTADGVHANACAGDFIIKNSTITATIDDAINIHSLFFVTDAYSDNKMIVKRPLATRFEKVFAPGDEIALYKHHTMELVDKYKLIDVKKVDHVSYEFVLDKPIKEFYENSLVENLSRQPNIYISDSTFGKANTHLRFQTRGKVRVNNVKTSMDLLFTGDTNYWFESSPNEDAIIENVQFLMTKRYGVASIPEFKSCEKERYYHKNITVKNCEFASNLGLYLRYTDNISLLDCTSKIGEPLEVILDHCGSFTTNCKVDEKRKETKADRDE